MSRKRKDKSYSQKCHALKRAWERYGLLLSREEYNNIVNMIQTGLSTPVERQSNRVVIHDVIYKEKKIRVVYDANRKTIASFLPLD